MTTIMSASEATAYLKSCKDARDAGFAAMRMGVDYAAGPYENDDLDWHWRSGWRQAAEEVILGRVGLL